MSNYANLKKNNLFFYDVYTYFTRGGYWCILVENIFNIVITAITFIFVTFVCFFLNWGSIKNCESEKTCGSMYDYIISPVSFHGTYTNFFMFLIIVMFFVYWLWITFALTIEIFKYAKYKTYFRDMLEITTGELKVLSWNDVIRKMVRADSELTVEEIVGSIMRRDNYLITFVSLNIFNMNPMFYTNTFLWLIDVCIFSQIFSNTKFDIKLIDYKRIKKILKLLGILQLCLIPFTLFIMIIYYIVSFTTDIYTKKLYIGPKEWTTYAKLLFREYNELPHIFNDRIAKSYKYTEQYEQKFNSHMTNILMKKIIFVLGTYLTILLIMTLYDERLLMYIRLFDRNLLWFAAIITSCISLARMMITYPSTIDETAEEIISNMSKYTHYYPEKWRGNCHRTMVLNEFKQLYGHKIIGMVLELVSVIIIPFYILLKLSKDMDTIEAFIIKYTTYAEKNGHICKFAALNNNQEDDHQLLMGDEKVERSNKNFLSYYNGFGETNPNPSESDEPILIYVKDRNKYCSSDSNENKNQYEMNTYGTLNL